MLQFEKTNLIKEFRSFLDDVNYDGMNQNIRKGQYFYDPLPNYDTIKPMVLALPEKQKCILELLLLGDVLEKDRVKAVYGEKVLELLCQLEIVTQNKKFIKTDGYLLISYMDRYFFIGIPYMNPNCDEKDPAVYIGFDTYRLTNRISSRQVDKVLDLCTGSGIQGVFGTTFADQGIAVELNEKAVPVTKFNVALNGLQNKLTVHQGSLYEPVNGQKFDRIYSNPPFIAVPDSMEYPIAGAGGTDGLSIVRDIADGFNKYLNENGYGIMIGEAIGDENGPFLVNVLEELLPQNFETTVILDMKITLDAQMDRCTSVTKAMGKEKKYTVEQLFNKCIEIYEKMNVTAVYSFYIKAHKKKGGSGKVNVIDFTRKWNKFTVPNKNQISAYQTINLNSFYGFVVDGKVRVSVNDTIIDFMELVDGKRTIEEIFEMLKETKKDKFAYKSKVEFIEDITQVCGLLEEHNLISK